MTEPKPGRAGVWIDHRQARIVWVPRHETDEQQVITMTSDVESRHRAFGGEGTARPGHLGGNVESRYQRRRAQEMDRFYERVVAAVRTASEVVLLGPGDAHEVLARAIEGLAAPRPRVVVCDRCDHPTDPQLVARVELLLHPARGPNAARR